jgi:dTMP kinase
MFITLEGIEGSGKTTQLPHMVAYLRQAGHRCIVTREPGGTRIGRKIRAILLDPENSGLDSTAELLLYTADRAQHLAECVRPALAAGQTVLCDRYFDATRVYQGVARGLDSALVNHLHDLALGGLLPDLTFLLDLPAEVGLARALKQIAAGARSGRETRFEQEALQFHEKVRAGYLALAGREPGRIRVIDADRSEAEVRRDMLAVLAGVRAAEVPPRIGRKP